MIVRTHKIRIGNFLTSGVTEQIDLVYLDHTGALPPRVGQLWNAFETGSMPSRSAGQYLRAAICFSTGIVIHVCIFFFQFLDIAITACHKLLTDLFRHSTPAPPDKIS